MVALKMSSVNRELFRPGMGDAGGGGGGPASTRPGMQATRVVLGRERARGSARALRMGVGGGGGR